MKWLALFLFLLIGVESYSQTVDLLKKEVKKIIIHDTDISLGDTPGFIIGVIDGNSTYCFSYGEKTLGYQDSLSSKDIFELGSTTKVYTAAIVASLVEDGIFDYSDPIKKWLPQPYQNNRLDTLTIAHLLMHYSPFPRLPAFFGRKTKDSTNPYAHYTKKDLLEYYAQLKPRKRHRGHSYSHINYALLEILIENATQKSYAEALKTYINDPLSLSSTYLNNDILDITSGYNKAKSVTSPWTFASFAASEGIKSDLQDMLIWSRAHLDIDSTYNPTWSANLMPRRSSSFNEHISAGYGWQILKQKDTEIAIHTGRTNGHTSFIGLVPSTHTGVVVLANSSIGVENLGVLILRMLNNNWKRKGHEQE